MVPEIEGVTWHRSFDMALGHASSMWGGAAYLPLPLQDGLVGHDLFWRVADIFDADAYEVTTPSMADIGDLDRQWRDKSAVNLRAKSPEMSDADVDEYLARATFDSDAIPEDLAILLLDRLAPLGADHHREMLDGGIRIIGHVMDMAVGQLVDLPTSVQTVHAGDPLLSLMITAELGRLTGQAQRQLTERGIEVIEQTVADAANAATYLYSDHGQSGSWPWAMTLTGLEIYTFGWVRRPPVVVVGDDVWDFVLFYALRRLGTWAWWLPSQLRADPLVSHLLKNRVLRGGWRSGLHPAVTSYSSPLARDEVAAWLAEDDARMQVEGAATREVKPTVEDWAALLPEVPNRLYERGGEGQSLGVVIQDGVSSPLPTPLPAEVRHQNEIETQWMVDTRVDGWAPVRHPAVAATLFSGARTSDYLQRPSTDGAVYVATGTIQTANTPLPSLAIRPRLRPLPLLRQVQLILTSRGWKAEVSDKGAYAQRASDIFGGFNELTVGLRDESNRLIFRAYLSGKKEPEALGKWVPSERRRLLTRADFTELLGDSDQADAAVGDLLRREALQLGTVLKCRRCRQAVWYDVDAFGRSFTCARCRLEQVADSDAWLGHAEPGWSYRLDEALLQFLRNHGDIPVLAATQILGDRAQKADVTFELDIWSPLPDDGDAEKSEIDLVISAAGRLIIGEATTSNSLCASKADEMARLARLDEIARQLSAHRVVLASTNELREMTQKRAVAQFPGPWPTLEFVPDIEGVPRPDNLID